MTGGQTAMPPCALEQKLSERIRYYDQYEKLLISQNNIQAKNPHPHWMKAEYFVERY